jgi:hypothetical protein
VIRAAFSQYKQTNLLPVARLRLFLLSFRPVKFKIHRHMLYCIQQHLLLSYPLRATTFMDSLLFSFFFFTPTHSFRLGVSDDDEKKHNKRKRPQEGETHIIKKCFSFLLCFFRTSTNLDDDLKLVYWCVHIDGLTKKSSTNDSFSFKFD